MISGLSSILGRKCPARIDLVMDFEIVPAPPQGVGERIKGRLLVRAPHLEDACHGRLGLLRDESRQELRAVGRMGRPSPVNFSLVAGVVESTSQ
jgi:hypothetical protein